MPRNSYVNHYRCPTDGTNWLDVWSSACNDRCPKCHAEIQPYKSNAINVPLAHELTLQH